MDWPDVAKGISILGVVLVHATNLVPEGESTVFYTVNTLATPLRMPLFFLISGYFSVKVLGITFGKLCSSRLWFFLVPYLVWSSIGLAIYHGGKSSDTTPLAEYLALNVFIGSNGQWFLHSLILFNVVLWLTRRMPWWGIVLVALSPILLIPFFSDVEVVARIVMYLPVFLIGAYCRPIVTRIAESSAQVKVVAISIVLFLGGFALVALRARASSAFSGSVDALIDMAYWPMRGAAAVLSIPVGVVLSVLVARLRRLAGMLMVLGRHTLPIYLGHYFGMIALEMLFTRGILTIKSDALNPFYWSETWIVVGILFGLVGGWIFHLLSRTPLIGWTIIPPRLGRRKALQ